MPRTEGELVNGLVSCLQVKDTGRYISLFPTFDTLWHMVMHNPDQSPEAQKELAMLKEHPQALIEFDPRYNYDIVERFGRVLSKGEDSGIMWTSTVLQRFELHKDVITRNLQGYDRIAPERFKGYIFLRDLLGRRTFCLTVVEIQKLNGHFFGGQLQNILEASDIDIFLKKEEQERNYYDWLATHPDTTKADTANIAGGAAKNDTAANVKKKVTDDDDDSKRRKEVVDRKYYEGLFDNEIPVKLYVRYMKELGNTALFYDGLYKFGDNRKYLKLEITINDEGKWIMEDEAPLGVMELVFKNKAYTGSWSNSDDNGYDVVLKETSLPQAKMEAFDRILDQGASPRLDDDKFENPSVPVVKKDDAATKRKNDKENKADDKKDDKEKAKDDREKEKQNESDDEWARMQEKAKEKAKRKMRKFNKPKSETD
jgi:hypothetical protein